MRLYFLNKIMHSIMFKCVWHEAFLEFMDFGFHWIGVQKERMVEEDMYVMSPTGSILAEPLAKPYPHKPPKCSDCGPLFMKV